MKIKQSYKNLIFIILGSILSTSYILTIEWFANVERIISPMGGFLFWITWWGVWFFIGFPFIFYYIDF
jgi:hypothetical protein